MAVVFSAPFLAAIVIVILSFMAKRDDAQLAFGLAAVLFYSLPSVAAYVLTASISEIVLRMKNLSGRADQLHESDA